MADITTQDLDVRLQLSGCAYGTLANSYVNHLKHGHSCITGEKWSLFLLNVYLEILECHELANDNSCFTDDEIKVIFDNISLLTGVCFKPLGYTYTP